MKIAKSIVRGGAWSTLALGVALPIIRKRYRVPKAGVLSGVYLAPVAARILMKPTGRRTLVVCGLQQLAYFTLFSLPNDDADKLVKRVRIDYPIKIDKVLGAGKLPTAHLQRWFSKNGEVKALDKVLTWCHWVWFLVPHSAVVYTFFRKREQFSRTAGMIYGTFNLGGSLYGIIPTAPPWYAAQHRELVDPGDPQLRRIILDYGREFWGEERWQKIFDSMNGNPLAAMPSLHFGTSVMTARMLREVGPVEGIIGWIYALALGYGLVHLGEHYVADLMGGWLVVEVVRKAQPHAQPLIDQVIRTVDLLEAKAQG